MAFFVSDLIDFYSMKSKRLNKMLRTRTLAATAALLLLTCLTDYANAVTVFSGAGPVQPDENVQFHDAGLISRGYPKITGATNNTGFVVDIVSKDVPKPNGGDFELYTPSMGQARVQGIDAADDQVPYSSVAIVPNATANPDFGFTEMEFNVNVAHKTTGLLQLIIQGTGFADITTTVDKDSNPMELGNGANFFGIKVMAGPTELIDSVQITSLNDAGTTPSLIIDDIRQLRISGRSADGGGGTMPSTVPEPSSIGLLLLGLLSSNMRWRRRS